MGPRRSKTELMSLHTKKADTSAYQITGQIKSKEIVVVLWWVTTPERGNRKDCVQEEMLRAMG